MLKKKEKCFVIWVIPSSIVNLRNRSTLLSFLSALTKKLFVFVFVVVLDWFLARYVILGEMLNKSCHTNCRINDHFHNLKFKSNLTLRKVQAKYFASLIYVSLSNQTEDFSQFKKKTPIYRNWYCLSFLKQDNLRKYKWPSLIGRLLCFCGRTESQFFFVI